MPTASTVTAGLAGNGIARGTPMAFDVPIVDPADDEPRQPTARRDGGPGRG